MLVVLTVSLGALFTALLRAGQRLRILLARLLFALTGWALMQYFVLPALFPLVVDKGFPPRWYAASFAVYGLGLGALLAARGQHWTPRLASPSPKDDRPSGRREASPGDPPDEEQTESWQDHMRRIREGRR